MKDVVMECRNLMIGEESRAPVSFDLYQGDFMSLEHECSIFFDVLQGLTEPHSGEVLFMGEEWRGMSAYKECRARGMMGRVFPQAEAWIQNISLIDNVKLRSLHHGFHNDGGLLSLIADRAVALDLTEFLEMRPENIPQDALSRAQLLRLFFDGTRLLLLERVDDIVKKEYMGVFMAWIDKFLSNGGAVIASFDHDGIIKDCGAGASRFVSCDILNQELRVKQSER